LADRKDDPSEKPDRVKRRDVYYVSGFDPKGAAWYHNTYQSEAPKQALLGNYRIAVSDRRRQPGHVARWQIRYEDDGGAVETTYDFLRWDDIMRANWPRGAFAIQWLMLKTYWRYLTTGILWRVLKLTWATFIAAAYPAGLLMAVSLVALVVIGLCAFVAWLVNAPAWIGLIIGIALAYPVMVYGSPWLEKAYGAQWLVRIYAFNLKQARRAVPELEERLDGFARHIVSRSENTDADEILIVGHSTGAQTAVSLADRVLRLDPQFANRRAKVSFLTIGGSIPMMGWQPEAEWFRQAVKRIVDEPRLDWLDFTVAQDGATFALQDPAKLLGLRPETREDDKPKLLSTKLFDLFTPETFKQVHRDWRRVHFHYLMASERAADYDYFAITAGPQTLAQRYAHRATTVKFDRFRLKILRKFDP
jgi:hypothetical protein